MTEEQSRLYELLETFSELCRQHGLRCYLAGGTLLGAVRHHGFIPWDDDIDVMMPQEDYDRFRQLETSFPEGLAIQSEETDGNYPFLFMKLCNTKIPFETGSCHGPKGLYIDIFPLTPSCRPSPKARFIFNIITVINYVLQVKCGWTRYIPYKKRIAKYGYAMLDELSKQQLRSLRSKLIARLTAKGEGYYLSVGGIHEGTTEFYPESWFEQAVPVSFEGTDFSAPSGWDGYLKQLYGDYWTLPAENERRTTHKKR